jgi:hypothetical protein
MRLNLSDFLFKDLFREMQFYSNKPQK